MEITEKRRAYKRQWRLANRDRVNECNREWAKRNPESVREKSRLWYLGRRADLLEYAKRYRSENPNKVRYWRRLYRQRKYSAEGSHTAAEWEYLKQVFNYMCPRCFRSEPEITLTEDHKIALSRGGTDYIDNIQPLCSQCNTKKHTRTWFASLPINLKQYVLTGDPHKIQSR